MPGSPFKSPFRGGRTHATPRRPQTPNARMSNVPTPKSPTGTKAKSVPGFRTGKVRVTVSARKGVGQPAVRTGKQLGTPGRHG